MLYNILEIRYCVFQNIWLGRFQIAYHSYSAILISISFHKRPISKIDHFRVNLFELRLTVIGLLGNSTTGLFVTGRCRAFQ